MKTTLGIVGDDQNLDNGAKTRKGLNGRVLVAECLLQP